MNKSVILAGVSGIAAIGVSFRALHNVCAYRVKVNVSAQFQQIAILINQDGLVSPLEKMAASFPFVIDVCGVRAVQVVHDMAQISCGGFDEQMVVVGHEDMAVNDEAKLCLPFAQIVLEFQVIGFGEEN